MAKQFESSLEHRPIGQLLCQVLRSCPYLFVSYQLWHIQQDTVCVFAATAILRMHHITWSVKNNYIFGFWNPRPHITYSLYNFCFAELAVKGHLHARVLALCSYRPKSKICPKMVVFGEKGLSIKFWFCNSKKAQSCAKPHLITFCVKVGSCILVVGDQKDPRNKQTAKSPGGAHCAAMHAQKWNSLSDLDKICRAST